MKTGVITLTLLLTILGAIAREDCQQQNSKGEEYEGSMSKTKSGLRCQKWNSQFPHSHGENADDHNYCRNPNDKEGVWCYTTDPNNRWDYCDVPTCGNEDFDDYNLDRQVRAIRRPAHYNHHQAIRRKPGRPGKPGKQKPKPKPKPANSGCGIGYNFEKEIAAMNEKHQAYAEEKANSLTCSNLDDYKFEMAECSWLVCGTTVAVAVHTAYKKCQEAKEEMISGDCIIQYAKQIISTLPTCFPCLKKACCLAGYQSCCDAPKQQFTMALDMQLSNLLSLPDNSTNPEGACYDNSGKPLLLDGLAFSDPDNMNIVNCQNKCRQYHYYGLQAGTWCYCGSALIDLTGHPKLSLDECNEPCPGNTAAMCGGLPAKMNLYETNP